MNWISCSTGTPINFDYEEVEGGLIIKDTSTGQTLNRSGDWLSLGHDASDGDKLWRYTAHGHLMSHKYLQAGSGGSMIHVDANGNPNVKSSGRKVHLSDFYVGHRPSADLDTSSDGRTGRTHRSSRSRRRAKI